MNNGNDQVNVHNTDSSNEIDFQIGWLFERIVEKLNNSIENITNRYDKRFERINNKLEQLSNEIDELKKNYDSSSDSDDPFYSSKGRSLEDSPKSLKSNSSTGYDKRIYYLENEVKGIKKYISENLNSPLLFDLKRSNVLKNLITQKKNNNGVIVSSTNVDASSLQNFFKPISNNPYYSETMKARKQEFSDYHFGERVVKVDYPLKKWLTEEIQVGKQYFSNNVYPDNIERSFDKKVVIKKDKNGGDLPLLENKKVFLGTGSGKSTFFVRCIASHNGGAILVVPTSSLAESILNSHNNWLSKGRDVSIDEKDGKYNLVDDEKKRVTVCPICLKNHSEFVENNLSIRAYETTRNSNDGMINIFTWWEFIKHFSDENKRKLMKKVVIFDEAHVDESWYINTISLFQRINHYNFGNYHRIFEMSATFPSLPISGHLRGKVNDKYVDWREIGEYCSKNSSILEKKIIVFCSDLKCLDFSALEKKKIEYLILNDNLKEHATEIVNSTNARIIVADSDYSTGFNFGDINVISTGISSRRIITYNGSKYSISKIPLLSNLPDIIQERGRCSREFNHSGTWISFLKRNDVKSSARDNHSMDEDTSDAFKSLEEAFKSKKKFIFPKKINDICEVFSLPEKVEFELSKEEGKKYLKNVLFKSICKNMLNNYVENEDEDTIIFYFKNSLIKHINEESISEQRKFLKSLINDATREMIKEHFSMYEWAGRSDFGKEQKDFNECFRFKEKSHAKKAVFIILLRDEKNWEHIIEKSVLKILIRTKSIDSYFDLIEGV